MLALYSSCSQVVDDTSSYLNVPSLETTEHIGRNHMDMCRFTGSEDVEYRKVVAALDNIRRTASDAEKGAKGFLLKENQKLLIDKFLKTLQFDASETRHATIARAHSETCKWLLETSQYRDWLDPVRLNDHHGFLWIKGKPGAGKSTLMKYAVSQTRSSAAPSLVISYFFNARGEFLEKSTIGLYRSLSWQLFNSIPQLREVFNDPAFTIWESLGVQQWPVAFLKELFERAIARLGSASVLCFIDALDECAEAEIRDMVAFFEHLGELALSRKIKFKTCFSSRHYPHITIREGLSLVLEDQEGHSDDIARFLDSELKIGHGPLVSPIRMELQSKATGIFMWLVLVVGILNQEYDRGRVHTLQQKLRDLPSDLHELFRDILMRDQENRGETLLCLQWILHTTTPLSPESLYFAILSGIEPDPILPWDAERITQDVIKRFIIDASKGLAEITRSELDQAKRPSVQFIHESVRDFLLKEDGLGAVWPELGSEMVPLSHDQLKQCCMNQINVDLSVYFPSEIEAESFKDGSTSTESEDAGERNQMGSSEKGHLVQMPLQDAFPFLSYAVRNVLHHASSAQKGGVSQAGLLDALQDSKWPVIAQHSERDDIDYVPPRTVLLYTLAENNFYDLIRWFSSDIPYLDRTNGRYCLPLLAALGTGSHEAIQAMLKVKVESADGPKRERLHELYKYYCDRDHKGFRLPQTFFSHRRTVLSYVAEAGDSTLVTFLLEANKLRPDEEDQFGRTAISYASERGHGQVVKALLDGGATVNLEGGSGGHYGNALQAACANGHADVAEILLERGADVNAQGGHYGTALQAACHGGHKRVVEILLARGADVNVEGGEYGSALSAASFSKRRAAEVKQLLVNHIAAELSST